MIAIVANPNALHFDIKKIYKIKELLESNNIGTDIFFTHKAKDGTKITKIIKNRYDIIAGYGGDGIINEIIQELAFSKSALGILPAGTTNVLSLNLKIPQNAYEAAKLFIKPKISVASLGNINNKKFILMAGVGFDAEAVFSVNEKIKKHFGKLSYILSGTKSYFLNIHKNYSIKLRVGNNMYESAWIIIGNAKKYAGNFSISNRVDIDSEKLDVYISGVSNRIFGIVFLLADLVFRLKGLLGMSKHIITDNEIYIMTPDIPIQTDGDFAGFTPAKVQIIKSCINVVVK